MTSRISNFVFALLASVLVSVNVFAQTSDSQMQALVGQSLSKLQPPTAENFSQCIAQLQRVEAMYPDSILPKYQIALQSLIFAVQFPGDEQAGNMLQQAEKQIANLQGMSGVDASDLHTLQGFYYTDLIVRNPALGATYYRDALDHFEAALRLNPDNHLAKSLQEQFLSGMRAATGE